MQLVLLWISELFSIAVSSNELRRICEVVSDSEIMIIPLSNNYAGMAHSQTETGIAFVAGFTSGAWPSSAIAQVFPFIDVLVATQVEGTGLNSTMTHTN